jgi:hypothetical protein
MTITSRELATAFATSTAALVLVPFMTTYASFRDSLIIQAALVVVISLVLALLVALRRGECLLSLGARPRLILAAVVAYAAASILGGLMGVLFGNHPRMVLGQLLSLAMFPATAAIGLAAPDQGLRNGVVRGLLVALLIGSSLQMAWWLWAGVVEADAQRLFLPNAVSVTGPALLGLLLAIAWTRQPRPGDRGIAWAALIVLSLLILGSALRSLWVLTPLAVVALLAGYRGVSRSFVAATALAGVTLGLAAPTAVVLAQRALETPQRNLLANPLEVPTGEDLTEAHNPLRGVLTTRPVAVRGGGYLVAVRAQGIGKGALEVGVSWRDCSDQLIEQVSYSIEADGRLRTTRLLLVPPKDACLVALQLTAHSRVTARWRLYSLHLVPLGSSQIVRVLEELSTSWHRLRQLFIAVADQDLDADPSLSFRWQESRAVSDALATGGWLRWLLGHGLGATVALDIDGFDSSGRLVHYGDVNYIHNFYLFLLFKLGVVGGALALGAILACTIWTVRAARAAHADSERAFLCATAVAWITYLVWSVTSPEILDFRMAPVWGLILAASVASDPLDAHF